MFNNGLIKWLAGLNTIAFVIFFGAYSLFAVFIGISLIADTNSSFAANLVAFSLVGFGIYMYFGWALAEKD